MDGFAGSKNIMHDPVFNWTASYNQSDPFLWNISSRIGLNNSDDESETVLLVKDTLVGVILSCVVIFAAIGNLLVVASVATNKRLRTITNYYVVSLAIADLLVAVLVMPLAIVSEITGKWRFGVAICDMWVSCDVLLCTASILNLCCISLDRYFAITKPLAYSTKRSKRLALGMIGVVWLAAFVITFPPILGWREPGRWTDDSEECNYISDPGYVVYSALGSFYLPLLVMVFVYLKIFRVASVREKRLRPYRRSFGGKRHRNRTPTLLRKTVNTNTHGCTSDSRSGEDTDNQAETSLIQADRNREIRKGKCVSVKQLREGLVLTSAMAMQDIARAHRPSALRHYQPSLSSRTPSADHYYHAQHHHQQTHHGVAVKLNNANIALNGHHTYSSPAYTHKNDVSRNETSFPLKPCGVQPYKSHDAYPASLRNTESTGVQHRKETKRRERAMLLRERKAAKTLAIVVGGFIACWLPFFIVYLIEPFCEQCNVPPLLAAFFVWLGYFNSVLNPFIYAFYNRDFRHSFWRLTLGHCARRRQRSFVLNKQSYIFSGAASEP